jgi:hypothetical protein
MDDCIEWKGARTRDGYGEKWWKGGKKRTHRIAYEWAYGPIPEGLCVLHKCDNPPCCNPSHLFLGTNHDNQQDSLRKGRHANAAKTHCPQGHPYDEKNTVRYKNARHCRTCQNKRRAERRRREKAAKEALDDRPTG